MKWIVIQTLFLLCLKLKCFLIVWFVYNWCVVSSWFSHLLLPQGIYIYDLFLSAPPCICICSLILQFPNSIVRYAWCRKHQKTAILKSMSSELAGIITSDFAGGVTVCDGTQQRLITLCVCATWHRVDAWAQDPSKRTDWPVVVPTCKGRDAAQTAVLQRVSIQKVQHCHTVS